MRIYEILTLSQGIESTRQHQFHIQRRHAIQGLMVTHHTDGLLYKRRADAGHKIIDEETLRTPHILQRATEHIQGEHIEEQMRDTCMHKHICHKLIGLKAFRCKQMQSEHGIKVHPLFFSYKKCQEHKHVYGQEILGYRWNIIHDKSF